MDIKTIVEFVKEHIEPLPAFIGSGHRYRVAAKLSDGLVLPCVLIESADTYVSHVINRLEETKSGTVRMYVNLPPGGEYRHLVRLYLSANSISHHDIKQLMPSPYAVPLERLREIKGETAMGWTGFTVRMQDGAEFNFGTTFNDEFFQMPEGYSADNIVKILPGDRAKTSDYIYRERPFFRCLVDGL